MPKHKKKVGMGDYAPTTEEQEAYLWGVNNGVRVAPKAAQRGPSPTSWYVEIFANGRWRHNGEEFGPGEVWEQVYKYYKYYYEKRDK